jgi:predicted DNA-binding transcriptional regulator AlpA
MSPQAELVARASDGRILALTHLRRPDPRTVDPGAAALAGDGGVSVIPDPSDRAVVTAEEAFEHLGIDRSTGYKAIREGTFPVPVIRVGRIIRVPTAPLRRALHLEDPTPTTAAVRPVEANGEDDA